MTDWPSDIPAPTDRDHSIDPAAFLTQIEDLQNSGDYDWASDTLEGIHETVEQSGVVTESQQRAWEATLKELQAREVPICAVLADPPYTAEDAGHYAIPNPLASLPTATRCLDRGMEVLDVGDRVGILHYLIPRPNKGVKLIAVIGIVMGFSNRIRAYTVYEKR